MQRIIVALIVGLSISGTATAETAYWSGTMKIVQSLSFDTVYNCEYIYSNKTFWRTHRGHCPSAVKIN